MDADTAAIAATDAAAAEAVVTAGPGDAAAATPLWTVVLPIKGGSGAKSRLGGPPELAASLARACLAAVLACPVVGRTVVVTADAETAAWAVAAGALAVGESTPGAGLNTAVRDGLTAVQNGLAAALNGGTVGTAPGAGRTAVLLADLPALLPTDLEIALAAIDEVLTAPAGALQAFVPDAEGTGTVLLAAGTPQALNPRFGPGSADRHRAAGAHRLDLDLARLRRDVDTPADLAAATLLRQPESLTRSLPGR